MSGLDRPTENSVRFDRPCHAFIIGSPRIGDHAPEMNEPSDFELLRNYAHNGDAGLFREVMGRHLPLAYAAALRASGDPAIAAEAAQDAFIKLHHVPGMFLKSGTPLVAWLHRVSRHRAIDLMRSEKARADRGRASCFRPWCSISCIPGDPGRTHRRAARTRSGSDPATLLLRAGPLRDRATG